MNSLEKEHKEQNVEDLHNVNVENMIILGGVTEMKQNWGNPNPPTAAAIAHSHRTRAMQALQHSLDPDLLTQLNGSGGGGRQPPPYNKIVANDRSSMCSKRPTFEPPQQVRE